MTAPDVKTLGPFTDGVADSVNPIWAGKIRSRYTRNGLLDGLGRLLVRPGTQLALTLKDDAGGPANVTSVLAIVPFGDGALAVAHSTVTSKFYLYWLKYDLSDWYDATKALQGTTTPHPVAVLWTAAAAPAKVFIAEGLGKAYIAHQIAGATFKTRVFDSNVDPATIADFQANLDGTGAKDTYFRGVVSFQQHLWGWGFGSAAVGDNDRPELLRFGTPFFGAMAQNDNFAVGHRVRSQRENVVRAIVAGQTLYVGLSFSIWPITGSGRNSWDKSRPIDGAYGFVGPGAACEGPNSYLYYWSYRGPLRVRGYGPPEPLWPRIAAAVAGLINEANVVCEFDQNTDQVVFYYQSPTSGRVSALCAYDTVREAFLGPDGDIGLGIACASYAEQVRQTVGPGPAGAPTGESTTGIGALAATAHWTDGDLTPGCVAQVEYRIQGATTWTVATSSKPAAGANSVQITGLLPGISYEWRVKNVLNGQSSAYLGPSVGTQFVTLNKLLPPTGVVLAIANNGFNGTPYVSWANSGEDGVSTEVYFAGPSGVDPSPVTLKGTAAPGESFMQITPDVVAHGVYWARVRHVKGSITPSDYVPTPSASASFP